MLMKQELVLLVLLLIKVNIAKLVRSNMGNFKKIIKKIFSKFNKKMCDTCESSNNRHLEIDDLG